MPNGYTEIHSETRDGRKVTLSYDLSNDQAAVSVESSSEDFTLYPADHQALDCFRHPYAYANAALTRGTFQGVSALLAA